MPKEVKKKQLVINTVTLDTGWFAYYQLRESNIAHIVGVNINTHILSGDNLWPPLLAQMETITRKEGYFQLLHTDYMRNSTAKFFTDRNWQAIKSDIGQEAGTFILFKDMSKEKPSSLPFKVLFGDDIKDKIKQIVESSHLPKPEEIDKELEPNIPWERPGRRMTIEEGIILDDIPVAPAPVGFVQRADGTWGWNEPAPRNGLARPRNINPLPINGAEEIRGWNPNVGDGNNEINERVRAVMERALRQEAERAANPPRFEDPPRF
jgi:hypothetical protein